MKFSVSEEKALPRPTIAALPPPVIPQLCSHVVAAERKQWARPKALLLLSHFGHQTPPSRLLWKGGFSVSLSFLVLSWGKLTGCETCLFGWMWSFFYLQIRNCFWNQCIERTRQVLGFLLMREGNFNRIIILHVTHVFPPYMNFLILT